MKSCSGNTGQTACWFIFRSAAGIRVCADTHLCAEHAVHLPGGVAAPRELCDGGRDVVWICDDRQPDHGPDVRRDRSGGGVKEYRIKILEIVSVKWYNKGGQKPGP